MRNEAVRFAVTSQFHLLLYVTNAKRWLSLCWNPGHERTHTGSRVTCNFASYNE
jgi:hypothetical protein